MPGLWGAAPSPSPGNVSSLPQGTGSGQLLPLIPSAWPPQGSKPLHSPGEKVKTSQRPSFLVCPMKPEGQDRGPGEPQSLPLPSDRDRGCPCFQVWNWEGRLGLITEGSGMSLLGFEPSLHYPLTLGLPQVASRLGLGFLLCKMQLVWYVLSRVGVGTQSFT